MKNERCESRRTDALYEKDGELYEFEAEVISCIQRDKLWAVTLDRTAFFPEGGGQMCDDGSIEGVTVCKVLSEGDDIVHFLEAPLKEGSTVKGCIDRERRLARMRAHIAEHIVCGLGYKLYGYDNVGFHMSEEDVNGRISVIVTMDLNGPLTPEQVRDIEYRTNKAVMDNVPIYPEFPGDEELKSLEFRSKIEFEGNVRLVTVEGYDTCACCAPCLHETGQIGPVKIIDSMPHRGGMRFTLIAGEDAVSDYFMLDDSARSVMKVLSSKREEISEGIVKYAESVRSLQEELTELKKRVSSLMAGDLDAAVAAQSETDCRFCIYFAEGLDEIQIRTLLNGAVTGTDRALAMFVGSDGEGYRYIIAKREETKDFSLRALAKELNEAFDGRGGGSEKMVQGSLKATRQQLLKFANNN